MYLSTRGGEKLTASKAILNGLASDGGLFLPEKLGKLNIDANFLKKGYKEIAFEVLRLFLDDFTDSEIIRVIDNSYNKDNFEEDFVKIKNFGDISFLELYHGPTLAFKDMALTMLPFLIEESKRKNNVNYKSLIFVATSGDTGGAALSSFIKNPTFDTVVLYPNGGVSEIQEKQMLYYTNDRTKAIAMNGNFDDCQSFVKEIFAEYNEDSGVKISSANSINIGRLIPQVIYYVYSYVESVNKGYIKFNEQFNVCVPTGNFGDIFAGYLAKQIGVPIKRFTCASNVNNVLTKFFKEGVYDKNREFYKSNSPAMDILISSNLERLLYYIVGENPERVKECMNLLKSQGKYSLTQSEMESLSEFISEFATETETLQTIKKVFDKYNYLIDPHTAVAYNSYEKSTSNGLKTLIVSTASPYKFPSTMCLALGLDTNKSEFSLIEDISKLSGVKVPYGISKLQEKQTITKVLSKEQVKDIVYYRNRKVDIKVPCSSANLGCGFDCMGIALTLYNTFTFADSEKDTLENFGKNDLTSNLVLNSYKKVFEYLGKEYIPVKITLKECQIPSSKGFGSSATCIVAGVLGANYMLKNLLSKDEICKIITMIEGHPDNVVPSYLGGLVTSIIKEDGFVTNLHVEVDKSLVIYALIPNFEINTKKARKILPTSVSRQDAIHNASRTAFSHYAFSKGDLELIKEIFNDKLHHPYRYGLINGSEVIKKIAEENGYALAISGAGPSLLAVGKKEGLEKLIPNKVQGNTWQVIKLKPCFKGAEILW